MRLAEIIYAPFYALFLVGPVARADELALALTLSVGATSQGNIGEIAAGFAEANAELSRARGVDSFGEPMAGFRLGELDG